MNLKNKNLVLIGMPSSGKTTTGKFLSEKLNMEFLDTDKIIMESDGRALRDIVNTEGLKYFLELQDREITKINTGNSIIATGGSVIYGNTSMMHLKSSGRIIYLKVPYEIIEKRVGAGRRFARNDGQTLLDLYNERVPLYEKYADIVIECNEDDAEIVADRIINTVEF